MIGGAREVGRGSGLKQAQGMRIRRWMEGIGVRKEVKGSYSWCKSYSVVDPKSIPYQFIPIVKLFFLSQVLSNKARWSSRNW